MDAVSVSVCDWSELFREPVQIYSICFRFGSSFYRWSGNPGLSILKVPVLSYLWPKLIWLHTTVPFTVKQPTPNEMVINLFVICSSQFSRSH